MNSYPDGWTDHYLAMLKLQFDRITPETHHNIATLYHQREGVVSLSHVVSEMELILKNRDWAYLDQLKKWHHFPGDGEQLLKNLLSAARKLLSH